MDELQVLPTQDWDSGPISTGWGGIERVTFQSGDCRIVGNLVIPNGPGGRPAVAILGPVASVKEQSPLQCALRLGQAGIVALAFDPAHHGESGGDPRRHENGAQKVRDLAAALDFLASTPGVNPATLFAVGVCQGANWTAALAVKDTRLAGVALVAGNYLFPETAAAMTGGEDQRLSRVSSAAGAEGYIRVVPASADDTSPALLGFPGVRKFYLPWADRDPMLAHRGLWENRITRVSEAEIWGHDCRADLAALAVPLCMVHSDRAATPAALTRALFDTIPSHQKSLVWLGAAGQLQFYEDPATLARACDELAAFILGRTAALMGGPFRIALAGVGFCYSVAGYRIRLVFESETAIRWTYLAAPDSQHVGRTALETCTRVDPAAGLVQLAWTESNGAQVFDLVDLTLGTLHAGFVWPDGRRAHERVAIDFGDLAP